jgi:hypothetical protein
MTKDENEDKILQWVDTGYFRYIKEYNAYYYECKCPICRNWFEGSDNDLKQFDDPKTLLLANLVTHHRHAHQQHEHRGIVGHEEVNEHAKQQYALRCPMWLKKNGFTAEDVAKLHGTNEHTIGVWMKQFGETSVDYSGSQHTHLQIPQGVFLQHASLEHKGSLVHRTSHGKNLKEHVIKK